MFVHTPAGRWCFSSNSASSSQEFAPQQTSSFIDSVGKPGNQVKQNESEVLKRYEAKTIPGAGSLAMLPSVFQIIRNGRSPAKIVEVAPDDVACSFVAVAENGVVLKGRT